MANVGNVELKVTLNKENITQELLKTFENCQSQANKNTITYKIAGDKSSLESMLNQIKGLTPELLTKLKLDFDKSDYDKEMSALKGVAGKTAEQIGLEFKTTVKDSLKGFDISQVIGKKLGKDDVLNVKDIAKVKEVLQSLRQQTEGFDLSKVTSIKAINDQLVALNKVDVLLNALSKHAEQKSIKIDGKAFDISQMLQQNTSQIDNVMQNAGSIIHTNASKWMADLENTFNTEYSSIVSMLENLTNAMQGVFSGTGTGTGSGGSGTSKAFDDLEKQIAEVTNKIKEAETELENLNKLKDTAPLTKREQSARDQERDSIKDRQLPKIVGQAYDEFKWDGKGKNLEEFKSLVNRYMDLGGQIQDLGLTSRNLVKSLKIEQIIPQTSENTIKQIEEVTARLNQLKETRDSLIAQQTQMSNSGTGDGGQGLGSGTRTGSSTPTTATVSPKLSEDFKEKLQGQVTSIGSVDVAVSGKPSETFKDDVQANINNLGTVNMGVSFKKEEGESKQEVPVDVIATPKLSDYFRDDLQKKVDDLGTYDIKVNLKDTNKENNTDNDEVTLINVKPNNIEDFKSQLKSGVEGDNGLDIKVNPVIAEDFNLEIKNATLKDVKVEGNIKGGNLKPATAEAPVTTSTTEGNNQEEVSKKLDETKKKQEEVGKVAVASGEQQKRSLLDVIKEYETLNAESEKLIALDEKSSNNNEMQQFFKKKQEDAKEYKYVQELITKIQSKVAEKTSKSATDTDKTKQLAGIVAYVERLKELTGEAFSYDVLGENGEAKFNEMKQVVDAATASIGNNQQRILELNRILSSHPGNEGNRDVLLAAATNAEKLELKLYETAKSFKANGAAVNTTTNKFKEFLELWKQYKNDGGTGKLSEFTDNAKLISSTTKEYNKLAEAEKKANEEEQKRLQGQVNGVKNKLHEQFPDVDLKQYTSVFDEILAKKKVWTEAFAEIKNSILSMQSAANGGNAGIPQTPQTPQNKPINLGTNGEINVVPKVEDPIAFANNVTEQIKGVSAEINIKPNIDFSNNINTEIDSHNSLQQEVEETKNTERERYEHTLKLLNEYLLLQDKIASGNAKILPPAASDAWNKDKLSWLINSDDTTKQSKYTKTTQISLKRLIENYDKTTNNSNKNELVDKIAAYTYALQDASKAESIFGTKHKELFQDVVSRIERAKVAADALKTAGMKQNGILSGLKDSGLGKIKVTQFDEFFNIAKTNGVEKAFQYLTEELNYKIPAAANKAKTAIDGIGEQTKQEGQEVKSQSILIPLEADIQSLNTSIQSKKDQILPVDVLIKVDQATLESLTTLDTTLNNIVEKLQKIIDNPLKINVDYSSVEHLSKADENGVSTIDSLKNSIDGLQTGVLKDLGDAFKNLQLNKDIGSRIKELAEGLNALKKALSGITPEGSGFLNSIKEVSSQANNLKDLATVIRASKEEIQKAKDAIAETKAKENTNVQATEIAQGTKEWAKIEEAASRYKDTLGEIQKITYSMRQDKDGKELKSYRVVGSKSSVTLGENLKKVAESETKTYQKTAEEMNKIRNDFIQAANKSNLDFNLGSLKVDQNGVVTFTSTVEKLGEEAVTTKYKIENLYDSLNKYGSLSKRALSKSANRVNTNSDNLVNKMAEGREKSELNLRRKAQQEEITQINAQNKALEEAYKERENLANQMADAREKSSLKAKGQNQKDELAQNQAINRALEEKYKQQQLREQQLQNQKDKFNEKNLNAIDYEILKREEGAKAFSAMLKAQMEANVLQNKYQYSDSLVDYRELLKEKLGSFKTDEYGKFYQLGKSDSSGNTVIQFVKEIGDKAVISQIKVNDLLTTIDSLQNGTFKPSDYNPQVIKEMDITEDNKKIKDISSAYTELIKNEEKYQSLIIKRDQNTATSQQLEELERLTLARKKASNIIDSIPSGYQLDNNELKKQQEYALIQSQVNDKKQSFIDKEATIHTLLEKTNTLMSQFKNNNIQGFDQVFERAKNKVAELNNKLQSDSINNIQTGYVDKITQIVSSLNNVVAVTLPGDIKAANEEMLKYASTLNNGNVNIGNFTSNNRVLTASFETQKGVVKEVTLVYDELSGSISLVEKGTKRVKTAWTSFVDGLRKRFESLAQYLLTFVSFYRVWGIIKQGVTYIRELDKALVEMRKVSDESVKSLKKFQDVSFDIANTVGTTAVQIQNSTADFMRLGESLEEATESARVANVLLNVSEFEDINSATDSLIAMSAAYKELEKQDIVDKLNEVGNNYAISSDGIATALQDSASALKTASNNMDEAIALVTAGNAVVQDPNSVGSGLRTIALRLTGTKEASDELDKLGEDTEGVVTTVSKLRDTIMSATAVASNGFKGFDIFDENGNYKSTYEILKGISQIYQEIVETDKKTGSNNVNLLLETMAGKNRANIAASILQNSQLLEDVYNSSANESQGSAQEELDKYLDSIEGKIAKFKNEVQEFWYNLISSETVKGFVDFGTKVIDILGKITDKLGLVGTAIAAAFTLPKIKDILKGQNSGGRAKTM